jgi:plasmid stabilization system protein ParE
MKVGLSLISEVGQDLSAAYSWYNERRIGLGEEFLTCVDACIQSICRRPELSPVVYKNFRRALVRRFPYSVFYEYVGGTVVVYAVFHTSQNPLKWQRRVP